MASCAGHGGTWRDAEGAGCPPHERRITDRIGSCHEEKRARARGEGIEPVAELILEAGGNGCSAREPEAARQISRGQPAEQFKQRERVAVGLGDDAVTDSGIKRSRENRIEQRPRVGLGQAVDAELVESREFLEGGTAGEEQPDRIGPQPAPDKCEYLHRSPVEPVQIINEAAKRFGLGVVRKQAQGRQADKEPVWRGP